MKTQKVRKNNNKQNKTKQNTYLNHTVMHIFAVDPFSVANNYSANERKGNRLGFGCQVLPRAKRKMSNGILTW